MNGEWCVVNFRTCRQNCQFPPNSQPYSPVAAHPANRYLRNLPLTTSPLPLAKFIDRKNRQDRIVVSRLCAQGPQGTAMHDPRLNSIHLDDVRRESFRQARAGLVGAVGEQTRQYENLADLIKSSGSDNTEVGNAPSRLPPGQEFVLVDRHGVFPLHVGMNTIGRLSDNDVVLPDPYLSRRHCAILVHSSSSCELHEMASKNGTFLNGARISGPTELSSGDEIRMCDRQLVFMRRSDYESKPPSDATLVG